MSSERDLTRRSFLGAAATAAGAVVSAPFDKAVAAQGASAPDKPFAPPEIPTPGRPQANDKFGASVDGIPIIDAHDKFVKRASDQPALSPA
jgi:hypothetical protein